MPGGISKEEFLRRQTSMTQCSYKCDKRVPIGSAKERRRLALGKLTRLCDDLAVGLFRGHPRCATHGGVPE